MSVPYSPALHRYDEIKDQLFLFSHTGHHSGATPEEEHLYRKIREVCMTAWLDLNVHTADLRKPLLKEAVETISWRTT